MNKISISAHAFMEGIKNGTQNIFLIGPSGVGKTEWFKSILKGSFNFKGIEMDERIGKNKKMSSLTLNFPGEDEAERMGNFFGKPWEKPSLYRQRENDYLAIEREEMNSLYNEIKGHGGHIIDCTGSVIYCTKELEKCKDQGVFIYLKVETSAYDAMQKNFLTDPKPICWGQIIDKWEEVVKQDANNSIDSLSELYTELLNSRHLLYKTNADIILPWVAHRENANPKDPDSFFNQVLEYL